MSMQSLLERKPGPAVSLLVTAVLLAAVLLGDWATGIEISFSIFYLFPAIFATWCSGRPAGLVVSAASAVLWFITDVHLGGRTYSHQAIPYWNAFMRGGYFVAVCLLVDVVKSMLRLRDRLSELKSEMLAYVAHEFGNQLAILEMGLVLLREEKGAEDAARRDRVYETMQRSMATLKHSVANFLNSARLESGRFALNLRRTELRKIVAESLDAMALLIAQKNLQVQRDFPPDIVPLEADTDAMALVMSNLLGNAVKYSPVGGRIAVRLALAPESSAVVVSVEDTGIGIPKAEQEKILTGFYRTTGASAEAKGFGVGLKVTQDLLESHGSRLDVSSDPGRGSRFFFRLKVLKEGPPPSSAPIGA